jgi:hypothetical protein
MPLSWNEIKSRAIAFSKEWAGEKSERASAQSFWNDFFQVFGIDRRRVAVFEKQVELYKVGKRVKQGRIDAFWKGVVLIEHKSAGQDLDRAFKQATDYFEGIGERELPRYILVSDFTRFRLYDLEANEGSQGDIEFKLTDLHKHIKQFGFMAGYKAVEIKAQDPVNIKAAEQMGRLHDQLKAAGYTGHALEVLLVRVLFCLFADDTGIFQPAYSFRDWVDERTDVDGSDLGSKLAHLFQVLNTPDDKRPRTLDQQLRAFAYVNGKLFEEALPLADFDSKMRETLLECCDLDWSAISPAIFGALFQSIMDSTARRNLGAHYTSEDNILKVIKPLFLDDLWAEFKKVSGNKQKLAQFHAKLRELTFFDPACGCGNFLIISYRELRLLELAVLRAAHDIEGGVAIGGDGAMRVRGGTRFLDIHAEVKLDVDQFYGIEIEEFPAQIAQVAMWLIDHQMNVMVGEEFGSYFARIPLRSSPHILNGNALTTDWATVLDPDKCSYIMGNPPFVGKKEQGPSQKAAMELVMRDLKGAGVLDFVCAWYVLAAKYCREASRADLRCAFVSTNSITQGEQVAVLWGWLLAQDVKIHFAHRTFQWSSEARGKAAVHCVIIGFGLANPDKKTIFDYEDPRGEPQALLASNINPYLVDAPDVLVLKRSAPISGGATINYGSMANDDGHLTLSPDELTDLIRSEPAAKRFIREFIGGFEFINSEKRYCLWLQDASPSELKSMRAVMARVQAVKSFRQSSGRAETRALAATPSLFGEIRQPETEYLLLPKVSSEGRPIMPIGFVSKKVIASGSALVVPSADMFSFGVLQSTMHMAWMRAVCGRLESRYQYSAQIVYNNFPWPGNPSAAARSKVEEAAQGVLDARAAFPQSTLADLYDPLTMPPALVKAHQRLDAAVDAAYGRRTFKSDAERVAYLFGLYQEYTSLLPTTPATAAHRKASKRAGRAVS